MRVYLPVPHPDEMIESAIGRYMVNVGATNMLSIARDLFGKDEVKNCLFAFSIRRVSDVTRHVWNITAEEIIEKHTLIPYYTYYLNPERRNRILDHVCSRKARGLAFELGLPAGIIKLPKYYRYCAKCKERDEDSYGEPFFHRIHHLAGVIVCPIHGEILLNTRIRMGRLIETLKSDPSALNGRGDLRRICSFTGNGEWDMSWKLAVRCAQILSHRVMEWPADDSKVYRKAAIARHLSRGRYLAMSSIEKGITEFYGALLPKITKRKIRDKGWLARIITGRNRPTNPAQHALVQLYFESLSASAIAEELPLPKGPWKCPNPYAHHDLMFPILPSMVSYHRKKDGKIDIRASCTCGFKFIFSKALPDGLPSEIRITRYGPTWRKHALHLQNQGMKYAEIAATMGSNENVIMRLITRRPKGSYSVLEADIHKWRNIWLEAIRSAPNHDKRLAKMICLSVYCKLIKYDREWMRSLPRGTPADWEKRDTEWAQLLIAAGEQIKNRFPPRRLTIRAILSVAGLKSSMIKNLYRLPECSQVFQAYCETTETFKIRIMSSSGRTQQNDSIK